MENNIKLAANRLLYVDEEEAANMFVDDGLSPEDAFLVVKAGKLLLKDREEEHSVAEEQLDIDFDTYYQALIIEEFRDMGND